MSIEYRVQVEALSPEYQRLERKERLARKHMRPAVVLDDGGTIMILLVLGASFLGSFSTQHILIGWVLVFSVIGFGRFLRSRARAYSLETEETLFLGVYRTLVHLLDCLADPLLRKQAESELRRVTRLLDRKWTLDFKLAREVMSPILDFRQNLKKLPPLIQDASPDELRSFLRILVPFGHHLRANSLGLDVIAQINDLFSGISPAPSPSAGFTSSIIEWFKVHSMLPKGTLLVLALSSGPILFILATSNDFDKNVSLLASTTASVGLTGIYANYLRKK